ncbi:hypothetical protein [Latilactobacillus curvatus]|uniref:hypothetical protein n=1 Tax=Latilactobacillus curvatus TaxID=28038 RepID=UPI002410070D|nr:hypothetical protein [Latilactobacillus curvatus]MDG2980909.1 hypothetical protein [Latilactobacillus curvatus]
MNKRQMTKAIKLMSNDVILQEAGKRGLALIDLPESPYRNVSKEEFSRLVTNACWDKADFGSDGYWNVNKQYKISLILSGTYRFMYK